MKNKKPSDVHINVEELYKKGVKEIDINFEFDEEEESGE